MNIEVVIGDITQQKYTEAMVNSMRDAKHLDSSDVVRSVKSGSGHWIMWCIAGLRHDPMVYVDAPRIIDDRIQNWQRILLLRVTAPERARTNVAAQLQLELRSVPPIGAS